MFGFARRGPRAKRVKLAVVPELATRISMLQTGEADIVDGATGPTVAQIKASPNLKTGVSKMTACRCSYTSPRSRGRKSFTSGK